MSAISLFGTRPVGRDRGTRRVGGRPRLRLFVLSVAVVVGALSGAALIAGELRTHAQENVLVNGVMNGPGPFSIGNTVATSFGWVAVEYVNQVSGSTRADVMHGDTVANFVGPDQVQLQVTVQLTSGDGDHTVPYSPVQFRVRTADGKVVDPTTTTIHQGSLQPLSSVDGHVGFVLPRDAGRVSLEFTDPPRAEPVRIDLGAIDATPPPQQGPGSTGHSDHAGH